MPTYGNVPDDDIAAMRGAVRVASAVASHMPAIAPADWREYAIQTVLDGVLQDWVANGTTELDSGDEEDLSNLLRVCADIALEQDVSTREVAFHSLLRNAMRDWVANWNEE